MSFRPLILLLLLCRMATAQDVTVIRKQTDSIVADIDKATGSTQKFRGIRLQQYEYKMIGDSLAKVVLLFRRGTERVTQTWYQNQGHLLFSIESEVPFYGRDSIAWGGTYYFQKGTLIYYETLGHGKSEMETWDPQKEVLTAWLRAKAAVLAHLKRTTTRISHEAP